MDFLTLFLGVIIFIVLFTGLLYLYNKFLDGAIIYDLKKNNSGISVTKPNSSNYYFSVWIYVNNFVNENKKNSWDNNSYDPTRAETGKPIFYYGGPFTTGFLSYSGSTNVDFVYLQLGANSPKLQYYFSPNKNENGNDYNKCHFINITKVLPIQKWTHVIISTVGSIIEFYLDGKLVQTYTHEKSPNVVANSNTTIQIGKHDKQIPHDTFISRIERVPQGVDSKTAYNLYKKGPGTGLNIGNIGKYDLSLQVSQNNNIIKTYSASSIGKIGNIFK
jgi:hypothetical protein